MRVKLYDTLVSFPVDMKLNFVLSVEVFIKWQFSIIISSDFFQHLMFRTESKQYLQSLDNVF